MRMKNDIVQIGANKIIDFIISLIDEAIESMITNSFKYVAL